MINHCRVQLVEFKLSSTVKYFDSTVHNVSDLLINIEFVLVTVCSYSTLHEGFIWEDIVGVTACELGDSEDEVFFAVDTS